RVDAARLQHDPRPDRARPRAQPRRDAAAKPSAQEVPHRSLRMTPDTLPRASDLPPPASPGSETVIDVDHFNLWYGESHALKDVRRRCGVRQVTSLIAPSGCGKSTLPRSLNRLNDLVEGIRTEGEIRLRGRSVYARGTDVIALRKRMSMVFQ